MTKIVVLCMKKYTTTAARLSIIAKAFVKNGITLARIWAQRGKRVAEIVVLAKDLFDLFLG